MRRLVSKEIEEKRNKKKQLIVSVILISVMLFGTLGFAVNFSSEDRTERRINYLGYEFTFEDSYWITNVEGVDYAFLNNPNDLEEIEGEVNLVESYFQKPLYFVSEQNEAFFQIYRNLERIAIRTGFACIEENSCEGNLPLKSCEDNIIIISESNSTRIEQQESCVFIEGNEENLTQIAEVFLLKAIGIR
jgi:hypothetical protein